MTEERKPLERSIAGLARDLVSAQREDQSPEHKKETEYRSLCEGFPILLRSAGLAQATAFLRAKSKSEAGHAHRTLYGHLSAQLRALGMLADREEFAERAADPKTSQPEYRISSQMAMTVALWHKRLAQALLRKKGEQ